jgi:hypothetical protein
MQITIKLPIVLAQHMLDEVRLAIEASDGPLGQEEWSTKAEHLYADSKRALVRPYGDINITPEHLSTDLRKPNMSRITFTLHNPMKRANGVAFEAEKLRMAQVRILHAIMSTHPVTQHLTLLPIHRESTIDTPDKSAQADDVE